MNIASQVIQLFAWLLLIISYWMDDSKKIIFLQLLSCILYAIGYFFLGAYSALIVIFLEIIRDFLYYKTNRKKTIFSIFIPLYILGCILTYQIPIDIVPYISSIYDGFMLTKRRKIIIIGSYITFTLWILYDISCKAYISAITEFIIMISNTIILLYGFSKLLRRDKITVGKCNRMNDAILDEISRLDRKYLKEELQWDEEFVEKLSNKNIDTILLVKDETKIVGYINLLFITKEKYEQMIKSKTIVDDFNLIDITTLSNNENYININSIIVRPEYQNKDTSKKIIKEIKEYIKSIKEKGYIISDIIIESTNEYEDTIMNKIGIFEVKELSKGAKLYTIKK